MHTGPVSNYEKKRIDDGQFRDALEALNQLGRAARRRTRAKIVAITGDHNPEVRKRILSAGADMFVSKPLEIIEFRKKCFELLQS